MCRSKLKMRANKPFQWAKNVIRRQFPSQCTGLFTSSYFFWKCFALLEPNVSYELLLSSMGVFHDVFCSYVIGVSPANFSESDRQKQLQTQIYQIFCYVKSFFVNVCPKICPSLYLLRFVPNFRHKYIKRCQNRYKDLPQNAGCFLPALSIKRKSARLLQ